MRKVWTIITSAVLALCLTVTPSFAVILPSIRNYSDSYFTDVPDDWSLPYISACYELGLMSGPSEGLFAPTGIVTMAEGITVASRVHDLWTGGTGVFDQNGVWYQAAVDYALQNGILEENHLSADYILPATRAQLAYLLSRTLPDEDYTAINDIHSLPDVSTETPYSANIFKLYNAGILTGSDGAGTFLPDSYISRAELAAILCRLVKPETRCQFTPETNPIDIDSTPPLPPYDQNTYNQTINTNSLTAVLFYAPWCPSCKDIHPSIEALYDAYAPRGVNFGQVDVDTASELAESNDIQVIPTLIFYRNGQELKRVVGSFDVDECSQFLDTCL